MTMMKLDSTKMMLLAALGIGAYFIIQKRAVAAPGGGTARPGVVRPGYSATPNAYRPPSNTNANAAGWGTALGGLWQGFNGMNGNTAQQPGYSVGASSNSRAGRDAADANDIFMPGYGVGPSQNSRSSRDALDYDNTDSNAVNPAGQYEMDIPNNGWGEG